MKNRLETLDMPAGAAWPSRVALRVAARALGRQKQRPYYRPAFQAPPRTAELEPGIQPPVLNKL